MSFTVGVVCDIGAGPERGGRDRNEDNFLVCMNGIVWYHMRGVHTRVPQPGDGVLVAVCDGMGGHSDGDVASTTAAQVTAKLYQPGAPKRPAKVLLRYIHESHRQLHWAARSDGPVGMGTTLTAVWLLNGQASWVQVGDSRLYLHRSGQLKQLTTDQTRNEFARRDGRPQTPDGEHLAQTFIYGSRGLGDNAALRLEQGRDSGTEVLKRGDRLLLCSDGLTSAVDASRIRRALSEYENPQRAAELLLRMAIERGSRDNVTIVVVRVDDLPEAVGEWMDDPEETIQF